MNKEEILAALSNVEDPDLKKDLVSLGMIKNLVIDGLQVSFDLELTTPACPMKDMLKNACINAVVHLVNKQAQVSINVTSQAQQNNNTEIKNVKYIIAVGSGKGGVGKSTVAAGLAMAISKMGAKVGLLDADIYGPSVPTLFDLHTPPAMQTQNGKEVMIPHEKYGIKLLSIGFMTAPTQAIMWRGPMVSSAFKQFTRDVDWGTLDYLIIDLPPGTGDIQISLSQLVGLTGVVMVSTAQQMSSADVIRAIDMFTQPAINIPVLGIVENMSYFTPPDLPQNKYYLFGKDGAKQIAENNNIHFLGELPLLPQVQNACDTAQINEDNFVDVYMPIAQQVVQRASAVAHNVNLANA